ncbi:MAG: tRNA pseudouridine(55) synthase TruB [Desulfoplanes sp.]|nr:tRNA pseudouridine(55) synthase TruB [Desulfoplanes sp.]
MAGKPNQQDGILILDKPSGPTSSGCLQTIKHTLGQKKIGHAGTLDPMATGVLIVLLGQGTKLAPYLTVGTKTYKGELQLGVITDTYDRQGVILEEHPWEHLTKKEVEHDVLLWQALTHQEVPPVSAAKHHGKPLYKLHRAGEEVPVKTKSIHISQVEILSLDLPLVQFRVTCSQGTYIRSLAHSLGKRLECGAMLTSLTRERCHPFGLEQAHSLEDMIADGEHFSDRVISLTDALPHWPHVVLDEEETNEVKNGTWLLANVHDLPLEGEKRLFLAPDQSTPLALVEATMRNNIMHWAILRGLWSA